MNVININGTNQNQRINFGAWYANELELAELAENMIPGSRILQATEDELVHAADPIKKMKKVFIIFEPHEFEEIFALDSTHEYIKNTCSKLKALPEEIQKAWQDIKEGFAGLTKNN